MRVAGFSLVALFLLQGVLLNVQAKKGTKLRWSDEFQGTFLNETVWEIKEGIGCTDITDLERCGWGNQELQSYSRENLMVKDGILTIEARFEQTEPLKDIYREYTSARIHGRAPTFGLYGYVEARIKMATGWGAWPSFWMLPMDNTLGKWPQSGEIDIIESWSNDPTHLGSVLHFGAENSTVQGGCVLADGFDYSDDFHVFAVDWQPDKIDFLIDSDIYCRRTKWWSGGGPYPAPFNQNFFPVLNMAVRGDAAVFDWKVDQHAMPFRYQIDYVRWWELEKDDLGTPERVVLPFFGLPLCLPNARVEAEWFDIAQKGYEQLSTYNDSTPGINKGYAFRSDGFDVEKRASSSNNHNLAYVEDGEWVTFTVYVPSEEEELLQEVEQSASRTNITAANRRNFTASARFASTSAGGSIKLVLVDPLYPSAGCDTPANESGATVDLTEETPLFTTYSYDAWKTVQLRGDFQLAPGRQTLKLCIMSGSGFNIDSLNIQSASPIRGDSDNLGQSTRAKNIKYGGKCATGLSSVTSFTSPARVQGYNVPATIEAEGFDYGGEGLAYHDTTPSSNLDYGPFRPSAGVDVTETTQFEGSNSAPNGQYVSHMEVGEWLAYTVHVAEANTYGFAVNLATNEPAGVQYNFSMYANATDCSGIHGADLFGSITFESVGGGWEFFWLVILGRMSNVYLPAGTARILFCPGSSGINFDYFSIYVPGQDAYDWPVYKVSIFGVVSVEKDTAKVLLAVLLFVLFVGLLTWRWGGIREEVDAEDEQARRRNEKEVVRALMGTTTATAAASAAAAGDGNGTGRESGSEASVDRILQRRAVVAKRVAKATAAAEAAAAAAAVVSEAETEVDDASDTSIAAVEQGGRRTTATSLRPKIHVNAYIQSIGIIIVVLVVVSFIYQTIHLCLYYDDNWHRLINLVWLPAMVLLMLPMLQFIVLQIWHCLAPLDHLKTNSTFYSCLPPPPATRLPKVTIQMPVYKEPLTEVILPSIQSLHKAVEHYRVLGGEAQIFINDDGMLMMDVEESLARQQVYAEYNVAYVARPARFRRGVFKKASNLNYALNIATSVTELMEEEGLTLQAASAKVVTQLAERNSGETCPIVEGDVTLGELTLLVDADTRVPEDCLSVVAGEFEDEQLAYLQCLTTTFLSKDYDHFEAFLAYGYSQAYEVGIAMNVAGGDCAPLMGHNCFLRTKAVLETGREFRLRKEWWSEQCVSEDFDMGFRLISAGYIGRYATYVHGFEEGVSLSSVDEVIKLRKFCYGSFEMFLNRALDWLCLGPIRPVYMAYLRAPSVPWHAKVQVTGYLASYFAMSFSIIGILSYTLIRHYEPSILLNVTNYFDILLGVIIVFGLCRPIWAAVIRYRLRLKGAHTLWQAVKLELYHSPLTFLFWMHVPWHMTTAGWDYLLGLPVTWEATKKAKTANKGIWREWGFILCTYRAMYLSLTVIGLGMALFMQMYNMSWIDVTVIVPIAVYLLSHMIIPLLLNPELVKRRFVKEG